MQTKQITKKFIDENIDEILYNLRPDLVFEYFSKRNNNVSFGVDDSGWNIKVSSREWRSEKIELLGEYQNGKLVSGKWFNDKNEERDMQKLYDDLHSKAEESKTPFSLYLNKLLCQGKTNGGISWNEHDYLLFLEKKVVRN